MGKCLVYLLNKMFNRLADIKKNKQIIYIYILIDIYIYQLIKHFVKTDIFLFLPSIKVINKKEIFLNIWHILSKKLIILFYEFAYI